ncbi:hypothetical protein KJZ61_01450 [Candidatus Dependentiae bacterium]|nr:hypothetical protein [Candidatus Dependentiae bacterium]
MIIYTKNLVMCLILVVGLGSLTKAEIIDAGKGFNVIIDDKVKDHCSRCRAGIVRDVSGSYFLILSCYCDDNKQDKQVVRFLKLYPHSTTPQELGFLDPVLDPLQKLIEKISPKCYGNKATAIRRQGKTGPFGLEEEDYWDLACDRE